MEAGPVGSNARPSGDGRTLEQQQWAEGGAYCRATDRQLGPHSKVHCKVQQCGNLQKKEEPSIPPVCYLLLFK